MRSYQIPNRLTAAGCMAGVIYSMAALGKKGLVGSLTGILIPVICLFALFAIRAVGAGDIKLLAAIGSFLHTDVIRVSVISFAVAGLYGVLIYVIRISGYVFRKLFGVGHAEPCHVTGTFTEIHLSVAIAFGFLIFSLKEMTG